MAFTPIIFVPRMIEHIKSCPFLGTFTEIQPMSFSPDMVETNALAYTGTTGGAITNYITGNKISQKQANFMFFVRRRNDNDVFKLEVADFLPAFVDWNEYQQMYGYTPKFGHDHSTERLWADGGSFWENTEDPNLTDYMIGMHVFYTLEYGSEE